MTIAITAATGKLGRLVVESLKAKVPTTEIVAVVRNPAKAVDLGVAVRSGDYTDPASLKAAFAGVDKLLLISSNEIGQRTVQHRNAIDAARAAGVKLIVYTSLLHADTSVLSLAEEHRQTETALAASGVPYVLLRNGWYTENYTGSIAGALAGGAFIGSAGEGKIASAARADYAEAAAVVLAGEGYDGRTYELAGDTAYTLSALAAELSKQTGKTIPYKNLSVGDYAKALTGFGLPAGLAAAVAGWDDGAAQGALFDAGHALSSLIGRPTETLTDAVAAALKG